MNVRACVRARLVADSRLPQVEKLLLTGLLIFVAQGSVFQAFAGACIGCCFLATQARYRPFAETQDNVLKAVAEAQLFLTLLVSIVLRTDLGKDFLTTDSCKRKSIVCSILAVLSNSKASWLCWYGVVFQTGQSWS